MSFYEKYAKKLPKVNQCCFFVPLETGVKIIAVVGVVFSCLGIIGAINNLALGAVSGGIGGASIMSHLINLTLAGCLTYGTFWRKVIYVQVWLIAQAVAACVSLIYVIVMAFTNAGRASVIGKDSGGIVMFLLLVLITFTIFVWFWLTVNTYYLTLLLPPQPAMQPHNIEAAPRVLPQEDPDQQDVPGPKQDTYTI